MSNFANTHGSAEKKAKTKASEPSSEELVQFVKETAAVKIKTEPGRVPKYVEFLFLFLIFSRKIPRKALTASAEESDFDDSKSEDGDGKEEEEKKRPNTRASKPERYFFFWFF